MEEGRVTVDSCSPGMSVISSSLYMFIAIYGLGDCIGDLNISHCEEQF